MRYIFLSFLALLVFNTSSVLAKSGCCSSHGGVSCSAGAQSNGNVICNDGWRGSSCSYSSMVMCGGTSGNTNTITTPRPTPTPTPLKIVATPKPTPTPTLTPEPSNPLTPTPTPTSPSPINAPTVLGNTTASSEPSAVPKPVQQEVSTGGAVTGFGILGTLGWLGYKGIKKALSKLAN